jgi:hypothetical protein
MRQTLTPRTSRLLDIQGFDTVDAQELARFGWPPVRDAQHEG